ncbi:ITSN2, partial [Symbiodinium microadriaticum]
MGGGSSDPYCKCYVKGTGKTQYTTRTINDRTDPEWNEQLVVPDFYKDDKLMFEIYDKDVGKKDDFLGKAEIPFSQVAAHGFEGEVRLQDAGVQDRKEVEAFIKLHITSHKRDMQGLAPFHNQRKVAKGCMQYKLEVGILSADGLRIADWMTNSSDPYCVCKAGCIASVAPLYNCKAGGYGAYVPYRQHGQHGQHSPQTWQLWPGARSSNKEKDSRASGTNAFPSYDEDWQLPEITPVHETRTTPVSFTGQVQKAVNVARKQDVRVERLTSEISDKERKWQAYTRKLQEAFVKEHAKHLAHLDRLRKEIVEAQSAQEVAHQQIKDVIANRAMEMQEVPGHGPSRDAWAEFAQGARDMEIDGELKDEDAMRYARNLMRGPAPPARATTATTAAPTGSDLPHFGNPTPTPASTMSGPPPGLGEPAPTTPPPRGGSGLPITPPAVGHPSYAPVTHKAQGRAEPYQASPGATTLAPPGTDGGVPVHRTDTVKEEVAAKLEQRRALRPFGGPPPEANQVPIQIDDADLDGASVHPGCGAPRCELEGDHLADWCFFRQLACTPTATATFQADVSSIVQGELAESTAEARGQQAQVTPLLDAPHLAAPRPDAVMPNAPARRDVTITCFVLSPYYQSETVVLNLPYPFALSTLCTTVKDSLVALRPKFTHILHPTHPQIGRDFASFVLAPKWMSVTSMTIVIFDMRALNGPIYSAYAWDHISFGDCLREARRHQLPAWRVFIAGHSQALQQDAVCIVTLGSVVQFQPEEMPPVWYGTLSSRLDRPNNWGQTPDIPRDNPELPVLVLYHGQRLLYSARRHPNTRARAFIADLVERTPDSVIFATPPDLSLTDVDHLGVACRDVITVYPLSPSPDRQSVLIFLDARQTGNPVESMLIPSGRVDPAELVRFLQLQAPPTFRVAFWPRPNAGGMLRLTEGSTVIFGYSEVSPWDDSESVDSASSGDSDSSGPDDRDGQRFDPVSALFSHHDPSQDPDMNLSYDDGDSSRSRSPRHPESGTHHHTLKGDSLLFCGCKLNVHLSVAHACHGLLEHSADSVFRFPPEGTPVQHKLLEEPTPVNRSELEALDSLAYFAGQFGMPWRYWQAWRIQERLELMPPMPVIEAARTVLVNLAVAVTTPEYELERFSVEILLPCEIADLIGAVQAARRPGRARLFPILVPALPQPSPGWALFAAFPEWDPQACVIILDLRAHDGRLFSVQAPIFVDHDDALRLAGLPCNALVTVHTALDVDILLVGTAVRVFPGWLLCRSTGLLDIAEVHQPLQVRSLLPPARFSLLCMFADKMMLMSLTLQPAVMMGMVLMVLMTRLALIHPVTRQLRIGHSRHQVGTVNRLAMPTGPLEAPLEQVPGGVLCALLVLQTPMNVLLYKTFSDNLTRMVQIGLIVTFGPSCTTNTFPFIGGPNLSTFVVGMSMLTSWVLDDFESLQKKDDHWPVALSCAFAKHVMQASSVLCKYEPASWYVDVDQHYDQLAIFWAEAGAELEPAVEHRPLQPYLGPDTLKLVRIRKALRAYLRAERLERNRRLLMFGFAAFCLHQRGDTFHAHQLRVLQVWFRDLDHSEAEALYRLLHLGFYLRKIISVDRAKYLAGLADTVRNGDLRDPSSLYASVRKAFPAARSGKRSSYQPLPAIQQESGELAVSATDRIEVWRKHFAAQEAGELVTPEQYVRDFSRYCKPADTTVFDLEVLPTLAEVEGLILGLKRGRAPGPDSVTTETLQVQPALTARQLLPILLKSSMGLREPLTFRGGDLVCLAKRAGATLCCKDYRSILVSSIPGKVHHRKLRSQLTKILEGVRQPLQSGALPGEGIEVIAIAAKTFQLLCDGIRRPWGLAFFDLQSAYYQVIREALVPGCEDDTALLAVFDKLQLPPKALTELKHHLQQLALLPTLNAPEHLTALINDLFRGSWFRISGSALLTVTKRGTRPGDPAADVLFSLSLSALLKSVASDLSSADLLPDIPRPAHRHDWASQGPEEDIGSPAWADDFLQPQTGQDPCDLLARTQRSVQIVTEKATSMGMTVSFGREKTAVMVPNWIDLDSSEVVNHTVDSRPYIPVPNNLTGTTHQLLVVQSYKHLGGILVATSSPLPDVYHRAARANAVVKPLQKRLFGEPTIQLAVRRTLLRSLAMSKFVHTSASLFLHAACHKRVWAQQFVALWRSLFRRRSRTHTEHSYSVLRTACAPAPPLALALTRATFLSKLTRLGPQLLARLLYDHWAMHPANSWLSQLKDDVFQVCLYLPHLRALFPAGQEIPAVLDSLCEDPSWWPGQVKRAVKVFGKDLEVWHERRSRGQAVETPPSVVDKPYQCGFCSASFVLRKHLCVHLSRTHAILAPARHFAPLPYCLACHRHFGLVSRVQQHLKNSDKCLRRLVHLIDPLTPSEIKEAEAPEVLARRKQKAGAWKDFAVPTARPIVFWPLAPVWEERCPPAQASEEHVLISELIPSFRPKPDNVAWIEVKGKGNGHFKTPVKHKETNPVWMHKDVIEDFYHGDALVFTIKDSDKLKHDDTLGSIQLQTAQVIPHGYEGDLRSQRSGEDSGFCVVEHQSVGPKARDSEVKASMTGYAEPELWEGSLPAESFV